MAVLIINKETDKAEITKFLNQSSQTPAYKVVNMRKHSGKLKLKEDAVALQRTWRDEWK